ncbi:IS1634 family transposase [Euhalothece natronophila Z-M001]|uniref:IS1634 family transposase n=1 Tax=Euhalothece natronophila Z-M001 TaxID=522448 RepID=A0A5B8NR66_9CHRO|nr:IS1634 family transposase [Euhalothece natronophila]QDZ40570.1 IS1634 family transposase [Euhalothece natronophila Z-M001]
MEVTNLDHLGIVAGLIDEIGLVEQINELVVEQPGEKVSPGHVVKAMILNGLGLFSSPLYLFPKFFEGKPTEHLIGEGIEAEHLNDDRLGRVLDKLYLTGLEDIFLSITLKAIQQFSIGVESIHLDSSSLSVEGEYENTLTEEANVEINSEQGEKLNPLQQIQITYGYSRDKRPDLKQFMVDLICSGDGDIPVFLRTGSGNESDQKVFPELFKQFRNQVNFDSLMVADSALYTAENLKQMQDWKWLTRVPFRLKPAQTLARQIKSSEMIPSVLPGYYYSIYQRTYGGFRFLKDPMFLADSIFIKSPERIQAMVLILGLCLLIYNLGQRELRSALVRRGEMVKNQLGKETKFPTLRWIFQQFQAVHLLKCNGEKEISNLTEERLNLLQLFPKPCQQYYLLV